MYDKEQGWILLTWKCAREKKNFLLSKYIWPKSKYIFRRRNLKKKSIVYERYGIFLHFFINWQLINMYNKGLLETKSF